MILPLYRPWLDRFEQISVARLLDVFAGKYPIMLVVPERISAADCDRMLRTSGGSLGSCAMVVFPDAQMDSIRSYNKLLLSKAFYSRFERFSHILVHQTDAFVFSDRLEEFCAKEVDYWGAPWFSGLHHSSGTDEFLPLAGNGGFSLRKVSKFLEVLDHPDVRIETPRDIWVRLGRQHAGGRLFFSRMLLPYTWIFKNTLRTSNPPAFLQEDMFWAWYAHRLCEFRAATSDEALAFSWECQPRRLCAMLGESLPFGCHAWWKYDLGFWRPHLMNLGYSWEGTPDGK